MPEDDLLNQIRISLARVEEKIVAIAERQYTLTAALTEQTKRMADMAEQMVDIKELEKRILRLENAYAWAWRVAVGAITAVTAGLYALGQKMSIK